MVRLWFPYWNQMSYSYVAMDNGVHQCNDRMKSWLLYQIIVMVLVRFSSLHKSCDVSFSLHSPYYTKLKMIKLSIFMQFCILVFIRYSIKAPLSFVKMEYAQFIILAIAYRQRHCSPLRLNKYQWRNIQDLISRRKNPSL